MNGGTSGKTQKTIEMERDEHFNEIHVVTKNLKENLSSIGTTLDGQSVFISKLSENVDKNKKKMNFVMNRLSNVLQTKGGLIRR